MTAHRNDPTYFGTKAVAPSRYFALYLAQACWLGLGYYLLQHAFWPSSCPPKGLLETFVCSVRLPENGGWIEAALLTWLWSAPILVGLEISRRVNGYNGKG